MRFILLCSNIPFEDLFQNLDACEKLDIFYKEVSNIVDIVFVKKKVYGEEEGKSNPTQGEDIDEEQASTGSRVAS